MNSLPLIALGTLTVAVYWILLSWLSQLQTAINQQHSELASIRGDVTQIRLEVSQLREDLKIISDELDGNTHLVDS